MIASFSIKILSRVDTRFFKSWTIKEELSLQFTTRGSDKPICVLKFFKFLFNWFYKAFNRFEFLYKSILERSKIIGSIFFNRLNMSLSKYRRCKFLWFLHFWNSQVSGTVKVLFSTWESSVEECPCVNLILDVSPISSMMFYDVWFIKSVSIGSSFCWLT